LGNNPDYSTVNQLQMLVVPNNVTARQVPNVEGMMVYQKDNNKLYVQGDGKLNALAEEKVLYKYYPRGSLFNIMLLYILQYSILINTRYIVEVQSKVRILLIV
jgi:hypothetical protein